MIMDNEYVSIQGNSEKNTMMNIDRMDLIDFLIKEIDDLEPKYAHYPYYCRELLQKTDYNFKNNSEARRVFIKEICDTKKTQLIEYMIKHYFYYFE